MITAPTNQPLIFVVEDEEFYSKFLSNKLQTKGYQVSRFTNGEELLVGLEQIKPALILLDLIMPVVDGFTTLAKLKENTHFSTIPILVLSNLGQKEDIEKATTLGANGYIVKSDLDLNQVVTKVEEVLRQV